MGRAGSLGLRRDVERAGHAARGARRAACRSRPWPWKRRRSRATARVKTLFRTHDGHPVEAVLMRYRDGRRSICVSSQSGCPLTCSFCATGAMQFGRNLTPSEMLDQALHFRRLEEIDHCVFMGMGEPFLNVDNVLAAARRLPGGGHHASAHDDLDGRVDARPDAVHRRGRRADQAGPVPPRSGFGAAFPADAGERPLPASRRARGVPSLRRAPRAERCSSST